uniref:Platelet endothelial cell adhesion molecule n=1 Tax=Saimiri boliviensis boliviensis TaxID=39432 RepID=A0A2K6TC85_SAIBB
MQPRWARGATMWLGVLLALLLCSSLEGQENSFTINTVDMKSLPDWTVHNGKNLTLQCTADVSTTSYVKPQHRMLFYKDDVLFYNVSSTESTESYFIPKARVYDSGTYKCTVIVNNKEKTTQEYQVLVTGVPSPSVTLDKKEAIQGGVVRVNCSVPEEKAPIHFTIEKLGLNSKIVKQKREKTSRDQNFVTLEFPIEEQDSVITFRCQARIISGIHVQTSEYTKSDLVTVRESFSMPKFHISPTGMITEGDQLHIKCTIQVTHLAQEFPEIIIQKDKAIVANSKHGNEAVYSVMATVEQSGNYTCKVESSRIAKVSSVVVNITEMLSRPRISHNTQFEVIKGQTIEVSCQSISGTSPISYQLFKNTESLESCTKSSNDPAVFKDNPTEDVRYYCAVNNCHSQDRLLSEALRVKVIAPVDEVQISILSNTVVESGADIVLQCAVTEGSDPITYSFYREKETKPFFQRTLNDTHTFWAKSQASKEHEGQYYCTAFNRANQASSIPRSKILTVTVVLAPWKKGLIAVVVIGVIIALLIVGAKCYFLRKSKAKQMPVEMSRPAVPLLNSNNEKMSDPSMEANSHYGHKDDVGNHAMKPINDNKEPRNSDVQYTEVQVSSAEPHKDLGKKGTETVYSEIRKAAPDAMENRYSRTEGSLNGT